MFYKNKLQMAIAIACMGSSIVTHAATTEKTNFVTIMIDDMGFSDIGGFGGEIDTPTLDSLIDNGTQLTNFYSAPTSTPARAMFFTGKDNHVAGVGNMDGYSPDRPPQKDVAGYEGRLTKNLPTFPELLKNNGYHTIMSGKWDLGDKPGEYPSDRGFNDTMVLLPGGDIHYLSDANGKLITSQPPSYYKNLGFNTPYNKNGQPFSSFPPNAFSTDFYTDEAIKMLDSRDTTKPFYLNIAHIASHGPFQAPDDLIKKYIPIYSQGWDKLRAARFEKLKKLGLVKADAVLPPRDVEVTPWDQLSSDQQQVEIKRMATYAGLVEKLDTSVKKLVQHLKDIGEYENTVFFVMSDNGAAAIEAGAPAKQAYVNATFTKDSIKDIDKIGTSSSFVPPSAGLGMLSNTPLNRYKAETFEGGIHTAAFVYSPKTNVKSKGKKYNCLTSVMDISATILNMSGTKYPNSYKNKSITPLDGVSMSNIFKGNLSCPNPNRVLGFEQDSAKMVRTGDWKISQQWLDDLQRWDGNLYLFNIAKDPFELTDLSKSNTAKLSQLSALYNNYAKKNNVINVGPRIFSPIANLKMEPAVSGGMILGGTQVNHGWKNGDVVSGGWQHVPVLPQIAVTTTQPPTPALSAPKVGDTVDIAAEFYPPKIHQGKSGEIMVASYYKEGNEWTVYKQTTTGEKIISETDPLGESVDGSVVAPDFTKITPFTTPISRFSDRIEVQIYEGEIVTSTTTKQPVLKPGSHYFWVGYKLGKNAIIEHSATPITVKVLP